jgi:hypothetical protein
MMSWAREWHGVHNIMGSRRTMVLRAQEWHCGPGYSLHGRGGHRLRSGKLAARKGARPWLAMIAWRLCWGLDDGVGSGEVKDGAGKFWQPDGMSESLRALGFAMVVQRFIYREPHQEQTPMTSAGPLLLWITVATGGCHHQPVGTVTVYL